MDYTERNLPKTKRYNWIHKCWDRKRNHESAFVCTCIVEWPRNGTISNINWWGETVTATWFSKRVDLPVINCSRTNQSSVAPKQSFMRLMDPMGQEFRKSTARMALLSSWCLGLSQEDSNARPGIAEAGRITAILHSMTAVLHSLACPWAGRLRNRMPACGDPAWPSQGVSHSYRVMRALRTSAW